MQEKVKSQLKNNNSSKVQITKCFLKAAVCNFFKTDNL